MSNQYQQTLTGEQAADRTRPETLLYCARCDDTVLRSERFSHDHDLEMHADDDDAETDSAQEIDGPLAWAVWIEGGDYGTREECITVLAATEDEATQKARAESDYDEVKHVDGPFEKPDAGVWEFTYTTEHVETVVVEAPTEEYAKESANAERNYEGEFTHTMRTEVRKLGEKDRHTEDD